MSVESAKHKPKKDQHARTRGAAQFYDVSCAACQTYLLLYQKDGIGMLKRLYLDRIFSPAPFSDWQNLNTLHDIPNLNCANCGNLIGIPMIYKPEQRLALRLVPGTFSKQRSDGSPSESS